MIGFGLKSNVECIRLLRALDCRYALKSTNLDTWRVTRYYDLEGQLSLSQVFHISCLIVHAQIQSAFYPHQSKWRCGILLIDEVIYLPFRV
jgi:hypothetical protein